MVSAARDASPPVDAAARRDARDPRADRRAGDRPATRVGHRHPRPGRRPDAPARRPVDDALRLGPGQPRRRGRRSRRAGKIPPEAAIDSPDWYAPLDRHRASTITGLARARFATGGAASTGSSSGGPGEAPTDAGHTVSERRLERRRSPTSARSTSTPCARRSRATRRRPTPAARRSPPARPNPYKHEFTVRLVVDRPARIPTPGVDRRVFTSAAGPDACAPASRSGWAPAARRRSATPTSTATTCRS